jgi:hypothetical protein
MTIIGIAICVLGLGFAFQRREWILEKLKVWRYRIRDKRLKIIVLGNHKFSVYTFCITSVLNDGKAKCGDDLFKINSDMIYNGLVFDLCIVLKKAIVGVTKNQIQKSLDFDKLTTIKSITEYDNKSLAEFNDSNLLSMLLTDKSQKIILYLCIGIAVLVFLLVLKQFKVF